MKPETLAKLVPSEPPVSEAKPKRTRKRPVVKIPLDNLRVGLAGIEIYPGEIKLPIGRCALSIKIGKRRKLVCGKIESLPNSVRDLERGSRLVYEHTFVPSNAKLGSKLEDYIVNYHALRQRRPSEKRPEDKLKWT